MEYFSLTSGDGVCAEAENPRVTVIVPAYNAERYIAECMGSVLNQTYPHVDALVVNDGSTDNTLAVVEQMALEAEGRIQIISKPNGGLGPARNTGIEAATADYLMFLDSDDALYAQAVEVMVRSLQKAGEGQRCVVAMHHEVLDVLPGEEEPLPDPIEVKVISQKQALENLVYHRPLFRWVNFGWKLFDRHLFDEVRFVDDHRLYEDTYVMHLLYVQCPEVVQIDVPTNYYRRHAGSIMWEHGLSDLETLYRAYLDRALFFRDRGMDDLYAKQRSFIETFMKEQAAQFEGGDPEMMKKLVAIQRDYLRENRKALSLKHALELQVNCLKGKI